MKKKLFTPILITGSKGFIGSNLLRKLVELKYNNLHIIIRNESNLWRIKDLISKCKVHKVDLTNKKKLNKTIKSVKPKTIFHLSAYGAYAHQNETDKIKKNILDSTMNLLDECCKYRFNIFINTGSNSEYGFKKNKMNEDGILNPNSIYAVFKAAATHYCQYISAKMKLPIVTVRPFHVYGPYEERTRLIPVIIDNLILNKTPPLVNPDISRDLIYVEEVINLYLKIASNKVNKNDILNIGSGKQYNIKKIFNVIANELKSKIIPEWNTMDNRPWDQKIWVSDISKIKKQYNWSQKINLKKGISKTIKWHKEFYFKKNYAK